MVNRGAGDTSIEDTDVPYRGNSAVIQGITKQLSRSPEDIDVPRGGNPPAVQRITNSPMNSVSPLTLAA